MKRHVLLSTVDVYMQLRFRDIESNISPLRFFSELLGIHSYCNVNYEISIDHYRPPLPEANRDQVKTNRDVLVSCN